MTEREHLQDGISGEFWRHFSEHVTQEWGPSGLRYQQAVREAAKSADAVLELQKVLYAQESILQLMRWPAERISTLRARSSPLEMVASRRGPGL